MYLLLFTTYIYDAPYTTPTPTHAFGSKRDQDHGAIRKDCVSCSLCAASKDAHLDSSPCSPPGPGGLSLLSNAYRYIWGRRGHRLPFRPLTQALQRRGRPTLGRRGVELQFGCGEARSVGDSHLCPRRAGATRTPDRKSPLGSAPSRGRSAHSSTPRFERVRLVEALYSHLPGQDLARGLRSIWARPGCKVRTAVLSEFPKS